MGPFQDPSIEIAFCPMEPGNIVIWALDSTSHENLYPPISFSGVPRTPDGTVWSFSLTMGDREITDIFL